MALLLLLLHAFIISLCFTRFLAAAAAPNGAIQLQGHGYYRASNQSFHGPNISANGMSQKPAMGWNNYNYFQWSINEDLIRATADAMVSTGLAALGYEYINIDDLWAEKTRNSTGYLVPRQDEFPSGMKALADYIHGKGLKFGIYSDAGNQTCANQPGSLGYEQQDASTFASWRKRIT
eukprot:c8020_g1_i2 orf=2-532(-)